MNARIRNLALQVFDASTGTKNFKFNRLLMLLVAFLTMSINLWAETVTKTVNQLKTTNSWTTSSGSNINTLATNFKLDEVITISTSGNPNCGSIWGSGTYDWRLYQAQGGDVKVTAADGYTIQSVTFTFTIDKTGCLLNGSTAVTSGTAVELENVESKTFTVGNTSTATNGQVRITQFSVTYSSSTPSGTTYTDYFMKTHGSVFNFLRSWDGAIL